MSPSDQDWLTGPGALTSADDLKAKRELERQTAKLERETARVMRTIAKRNAKPTPEPKQSARRVDGIVLVVCAIILYVLWTTTLYPFILSSAP